MRIQIPAFLYSAFVLCLIAQGAYAYELRPTSIDSNQTIVELEAGLKGKFWSGMANRIIEHYSHNVHEELTNRVWGCEPNAAKGPKDETCMTWAKTPKAVTFGVQWNDNPTFKLDKTSSTDRCTLKEPIRLPDLQPACWYILFGDAAERASQGEYFTQADEYSLLYRTHFGDLQFMHSMASWNGERMRDTLDNVMMWAEFTYKVAIGEIAPSTTLSKVDTPGFQDVLGRYWGDVSTLFTFGVPEFSSEVPDVAFGSLLHMIEDSFSRSHSAREPATQLCGDGSVGPSAGRITEFYAYGLQKSSKHSERDSRDFMLTGLVKEPLGNAVTVGRQLKSFRDHNEPWDKVRSYLSSCAFFVAATDLKKPAGPGPFK